MYMDEAENLLFADFERALDTSIKSDPRKDEVQEYLETLLPQEWGLMGINARRDWLASEDALKAGQGVVAREKVCAAEVWVECLGKDMRHMKPTDARDICSLLRSLEGWQERNPSRIQFRLYGKQTAFIKV